MNIVLFGKKIYVDVIKFNDPEMRRSSWIIWVHSKFNDKYSYKREAKGNMGISI